MDKYTLLFLLNIPFVIFGLLKSVALFKSGSITNVGFFLRICFWIFILAGLIFAEEAYNFLSQNHLTESPPLSIADVLLVTGTLFSLFLCTRLYAKIDALEKKVSDLHERLSIDQSINNKK